MIFVRNRDKHQQLIEGGRERKDATASVKSKKNYVMVKAIRREDKTSRVFSIPVDQFSYKRVKREIRTEMGKFQSLKYLDHRASQKVLFCWPVSLVDVRKKS